MDHLKNTVIKVLSEEHGREVINWWKKQGVDTQDLGGSVIGRYYGLFNNITHLSFTTNIEGLTVIELPIPKENDYPKVMLVSHSKNGDFKKRVVFAEKEGYYIAWAYAETLEDAEKRINTHPWKYAKGVDEPIEITLEQIAEKFNVEVSKIKIVK